MTRALLIGNRLGTVTNLEALTLGKRPAHRRRNLFARGTQRKLLWVAAGHPHLPAQRRYRRRVDLTLDNGIP